MPHTGGWCDEHYAWVGRLYAEGVSADEAYGLHDRDRRYYRVPGRRVRRWNIWPSVEDTTYLEFRSHWVARYILVNTKGTRHEAHARWDHPLGIWLDPVGSGDQGDWEEVSEADFEQVWEQAVRSVR
jgi:hypothetical protein